MIGFFKLRWRVFTARCALSLYIRMRFVFKGLNVIVSYLICNPSATSCPSIPMPELALLLCPTTLIITPVSHISGRNIVNGLITANTYRASYLVKRYSILVSDTSCQ
jgi:hypothetical protein